MIAQVNHVEPVPRRVRAWLAGEIVFDTTRALYVWEWPNYPQYYIPLADVRPGLLVPEAKGSRAAAAKWTCTDCASATPTGRVPPRSSLIRPSQGSAAQCASRGPPWTPGPRRMSESRAPSQPLRQGRCPAVNANGTHSDRRRRSSAGRIVLADHGIRNGAAEPLLPQPDADQLRASRIPTGTVTECPYKGATSGYWSVQVGGSVHPDLAWSFDFPTHQPSAHRGAYRVLQRASQHLPRRAATSNAQRPTSFDPPTEPDPDRANEPMGRQVSSALLGISGTPFLRDGSRVSAPLGTPGRRASRRSVYLRAQ